MNGKEWKFLLYIIGAIIGTLVALFVVVNELGLVANIDVCEFRKWGHCSPQ